MEAALNACLASMEYRDNQTHVPFLDVAQARLSRNVAVGRDAVCKWRGVTKKEHDFQCPRLSVSQARSHGSSVSFCPDKPSLLGGG